MRVLYLLLNFINEENSFFILFDFILFRSELTQFLEEQRDSAVRRGESDPAFGAEFKYSAHINELVVGTVYLRNTVKLTKKMRLLYLLYFNMI